LNTAEERKIQSNRKKNSIATMQGREEKDMKSYEEF
jgi:hypothetical protein